MSLIYGLFDPITDECRYIGITNKSLKYRLNNHFYEAKKPKTHKHFWINKLLKSGLKPIIEQIDEQDDIEFWEKWYIQYFKSIGCRLTNIAPGGEKPPIKKRFYPLGHRKILTKKWQIEHPEECKKHAKKTYEKNKVKILDNNKTWRENNPDKMREYKKKWKDKNLINYRNTPEYKIMKKESNRRYYLKKRSKDGTI